MENGELRCFCFAKTIFSEAPPHSNSCHKVAHINFQFSIFNSLRRFMAKKQPTKKQHNKAVLGHNAPNTLCCVAQNNSIIKKHKSQLITHHILTPYSLLLSIYDNMIIALLGYMRLNLYILRLQCVYYIDLLFLCQ